MLLCMNYGLFYLFIALRGIVAPVLCKAGLNKNIILFNKLLLSEVVLTLVFFCCGIWAGAKIKDIISE